MTAKHSRRSPVDRRPFRGNLAALASELACSSLYPAERGPLVSQTELADELEISPREVRNLEARGLPRDGKRYPAGACLRWYEVFKQRARVRAGAGLAVPHMGEQEGEREFRRLMESGRDTVPVPARLLDALMAARVIEIPRAALTAAQRDYEAGRDAEDEEVAP